MARKSDSPASGSGLHEWASTHQWISRWLEDKTTPRKILEWQRWARRRMESGWSRESVEKRIREEWHDYTLSHSTRELEADLLEALHQVRDLADKGWTPAQCAVVYRSLYRSHPNSVWLSDWADRWEEAGDDWRKVVLP